MICGYEKKTLPLADVVDHPDVVKKDPGLDVEGIDDVRAEVVLLNEIGKELFEVDELIFSFL